MDMQVSGPAWELSSEYPAIDSAPLQDDLDRLAGLLDDVAGIAPSLVEALHVVDGLALADATALITQARRLSVCAEQVQLLLDNLGVYASCLLSVDSQDPGARKLQGLLIGQQKRRDELIEPLRLLLDRLPDELIAHYLDDDSVRASTFEVMHSRARRHELLSLPEERLIKGLAQDGIHAWGRLYDQLAGSLRCDINIDGEGRHMGLAEASGLLQSPRDAVRQVAWTGINAAWASQQESCAAALNAIAGWRLENCRRRSGQQEVHFLDAAIHDNRISQNLLDTLVTVAAEAAPAVRQVSLLQARCHGKPLYSPWDVRSPAPELAGSDGATPFAEAIVLIATAYAGIDPAMGEFVTMMAERGWIEGTVGAGKRPGAYCTSFSKSRTPRVYMTYTGGRSDIITLAHELGHAYHNWVMRDLPLVQCHYGMALAETASTLGEAVVRDALLRQATTPAARLEILWGEMDALQAFLLNIPARFDFETRFYRARGERPLRPDEICAMMSDAWRQSYGDCLSEPDPMFWASKLHFYISGRSFYNFPYLFGYLFSNGVYARRDELGDDFFARYRSMLRDTGRMTAIELAGRHLDVDLERPGFWQDTVTMLLSRVEEFEQLCDELFPAV